MSNYDAMQRLLRAQDRIVVDCPWLKGVADATHWIEWPLGAPMGTNGDDIYFDPKLVRAFDGYTEGFVLHEWSHNLCDHIGRRQDREPGLWNVAVDMAINPFVTKMFDLPAGLCLIDRRFDGLSPELIYDQLGGNGIVANHWGYTIGANLSKRLAEMPPDLSGEPLERARQKWRDVIKAAGDPPPLIKAMFDYC